MLTKDIIKKLDEIDRNSKLKDTPVKLNYQRINELMVRIINYEKNQSKYYER